MVRPRIKEGALPFPHSDSFYYTSAVLVGASVLVVAKRRGTTERTLLFRYYLKGNTWELINSTGPQVKRTRINAAAVHEDRLLSLDMSDLKLHSYDLVLKRWEPMPIQEEHKGNWKDETFFGAYLEACRGFMVWGAFTKRSVRFLSLDRRSWEQRKTTGEAPVAVSRKPFGCAHMDTAYVVCTPGSEAGGICRLYLLKFSKSAPHWSRPVVEGYAPLGGADATLTYSYGRLFLYGGFRPNLCNTLEIYGIKEGKWRPVRQTRSVSSEMDYNFIGSIVEAAAHSAVALSDRIMVFGGYRKLFKDCRLLQPITAI